MKKLLSKKEKARRQTIRRSPKIKQAIRRLDPSRILTLDRRDFSRYRLPDGRPFEIL